MKKYSILVSYGLFFMHATIVLNALGMHTSTEIGRDQVESNIETKIKELQEKQNKSLSRKEKEALVHESRAYAKALKDLENSDQRKTTSLTTLSKKFEDLSNTINQSLYKKQKTTQVPPELTQEASEFIKQQKALLAFTPETAVSMLDSILTQDLNRIQTIENAQEQERKLSAIENKLKQFKAVIADEQFTFAEKDFLKAKIDELEYIISIKKKLLASDPKDVKASIDKTIQNIRNIINPSTESPRIHDLYNPESQAKYKKQFSYLFSGMKKAIERNPENPDIQALKGSVEALERDATNRFKEIEIPIETPKAKPINEPIESAVEPFKATSQQQIQSAKDQIKNAFARIKKHAQLWWYDSFKKDKEKASSLAQDLSKLYEAIGNNIKSSIYDIESIRLGQQQTNRIALDQKKIDVALATFKSAADGKEKDKARATIASALSDIYQMLIDQIKAKEEENPSAQESKYTAVLTSLVNSLQSLSVDDFNIRVIIRDMKLTDNFDTDNRIKNQAVGTLPKEPTSQAQKTALRQQDLSLIDSYREAIKDAMQKRNTPFILLDAKALASLGGTSADNLAAETNFERANQVLVLLKNLAEALKDMRRTEDEVLSAIDQFTWPDTYIDQKKVDFQGKYSVERKKLGDYIKDEFITHVRSIYGGKK